MHKVIEMTQKCHLSAEIAEQTLDNNLKLLIYITKIALFNF